MKRAVVMIGLVMAIAGCTSAPETAGAPARSSEPEALPFSALPSDESDTCGATMYAGLIGQPVTGPGVPGEGPLTRHILPGMQVTLEYIAQRMNIEVNAQGMIQRINCG